jgi:hypothetical protein
MKNSTAQRVAVRSSALLDDLVCIGADVWTTDGENLNGLSIGNETIPYGDAAECPSVFRW